MNSTEPNNQEPVIMPNELKLPEEQLGTSEADHHTAHLGAILGVLILILILILGGLYLWGKTLQTIPTVAPTTQTPTTTTSQPSNPSVPTDAQVAPPLSTSTSLDAIQSDLNNTNLNGINTDLNSIDTTVSSTSTSGQ